MFRMFDWRSIALVALICILLSGSAHALCYERVYVTDPEDCTTDFYGTETCATPSDYYHSCIQGLDETVAELDGTILSWVFGTLAPGTYFDSATEGYRCMEIEGTGGYCPIGYDCRLTDGGMKCMEEDELTSDHVCCEEWDYSDLALGPQPSGVFSFWLENCPDMTHVERQYVYEDQYNEYTCGDMPPCNEPEDCYPEGYLLCENRICAPMPCTHNHDCPQGTICHDLQCIIIDVYDADGDGWEGTVAGPEYPVWDLDPVPPGDWDCYDGSVLCTDNCVWDDRDAAVPGRRLSLPECADPCVDNDGDTFCDPDKSLLIVDPFIIEGVTAGPFAWSPLTDDQEAVLIDDWGFVVQDDIYNDDMLAEFEAYYYPRLVYGGYPFDCDDSDRTITDPKPETCNFFDDDCDVRNTDGTGGIDECDPWMPGDGEPTDVCSSIDMSDWLRDRYGIVPGGVPTKTGGTGLAVAGAPVMTPAKEGGAEMSEIYSAKDRNTGNLITGMVVTAEGTCYDYAYGTERVIPPWPTSEMDCAEQYTFFSINPTDPTPDVTYYGGSPAGSPLSGTYTSGDVYDHMVGLLADPSVACTGDAAEDADNCCYAPAGGTMPFVRELLWTSKPDGTVCDWSADGAADGICSDGFCVSSATVSTLGVSFVGLVVSVALTPKERECVYSEDFGGCHVIDWDGDGYGNWCFGCPTCYDCNDRDILIHPGAPDDEGDGEDQNCNGIPDDGLDTDEDNKSDAIELAMRSVCFGQGEWLLYPIDFYGCWYAIMNGNLLGWDVG